MLYYTDEQLGPTRSKTPEGYLLCEGVPLARTGIMLYMAGETPVEPAPGEREVRIHRQPEEVFDPRTIASYVGKPLTNDHPDDDVTPSSWRDLACGIIMNPRRGEGDLQDCLLGDVLATDPSVIAMIERNEKTHVSVGYDADYEEIAPGVGVQKNIRVNHVALVEEGRCGPRCQIGDSKPTEKKRMSYLTAALHRAFKAKDAKELDAIEEEVKKDNPELAENNMGAGEQHVHVHLGSADTPVKDDEETEMAEGGSTEERLSRLESLLEALLDKIGGGEGEDSKPKDRKGKDKKDEVPEQFKKKDDDEDDKEDKKKDTDDAMDDETVKALGFEAPPGTDDRAGKARDSAYLADAWQQHVAYAEIIAPGARMPTFDSAARPAVTLTKLCGARAQLLEHAYTSQDKARAIIDEINGNRVLDFKRMTCDSARVMIAAVAAEIGKANNAGTGFGGWSARQGSSGGTGVKGKIVTPADLNKMAREMYKRA